MAADTRARSVRDRRVIRGEGWFDGPRGRNVEPSGSPRHRTCSVDAVNCASFQKCSFGVARGSPGATGDRIRPKAIRENQRDDFSMSWQIGLHLWPTGINQTCNSPDYRLFGYERGRGPCRRCQDGVCRAEFCAARTCCGSRPTGQDALVYPDRDLASDARGPTLRTQRLVLRRWRAEDLAPFAELNADPDVMAHMQKSMSQEESDAFVARIEEEFDDCGFGLWAVEAPNHSPFIGFVGLHRVPFDAPFTPAVEVGWRLAREHWGYGFVTEAGS